MKPLHSSRFLHQQISDSLREQIIGGKLSTGTRLPTMKAMAQEWDTSYFTIQRALAPLVHEGLLEPRGKLGTVVLGPKPRLTCAGIYFGADTWSMPEAAFYRVLHGELKEQLAEDEVTIKLVIDQRAEAEQFHPPGELKTLIENREIQSLIVPIANQPELNWLKHLPIAKSYLGSGDVPWRVRRDDRQHLRLALTCLKEQGIRDVGIICGLPMQDSMQHPYTRLYTYFVELVSELGMQSNNRWCELPDHILKPSEMEEFGYHAFNRIWGSKANQRPKGLISFSDVIGKGAFAAILEKRISVPNQLRLVQLKNKNIGFFTPLKPHWIVIDEAEVATALIRQVHLQLRGEPVSEVLINGSLE